LVKIGPEVISFAFIAGIFQDSRFPPIEIVRSGEPERRSDCAS
jgi:hypothetical protein